MPVDAEGDEVAAAHRGVAGQRAGLRQVPDVTVALAAVAAGSHGFAERGDRARAERLEGPRMARSSVVLPEPLGPRTAISSPGATVRSRPDHSVRSPRRRGRASDLQHGGRVAVGPGVAGGWGSHRASVSASAATFACIQVR